MAWCFLTLFFVPSILLFSSFFFLLFYFQLNYSQFSIWLTFCHIICGYSHPLQYLYGCLCIALKRSNGQLQRRYMANRITRESKAWIPNADESAQNEQKQMTKKWIGKKWRLNCIHKILNVGSKRSNFNGTGLLILKFRSPLSAVHTHDFIHKCCLLQIPLAYRIKLSHLQLRGQLTDLFSQYHTTYIKLIAYLWSWNCHPMRAIPSSTILFNVLWPVQLFKSMYLCVRAFIHFV